MKKVLKWIGIILLIIVGLFVCLVLFLTITEYKPDDVESAIQSESTKEQTIDPSKELKLLTWNIGYCGLGKEEDCFLDGGEQVKPSSQENVLKNLTGVEETMKAENADIYLLQEVDRDCGRTGNIDQTEIIGSDLDLDWSFAYNYKCLMVPYPVPPMGHIESGLTTFYRCESEDNAERISLPCPFGWPVRTCQLKRCLLVNRYALEGTDKELVTVNLHLEAYVGAEERAGQYEKLFQIMEEEYEKGNYVIAGGDFNQYLPETEDLFTCENEYFNPGNLDDMELPEHFAFTYDTSIPSSRLNNQPYDPEDVENTRYFVIDGYITADNVEVLEVNTLDAGFEYSDHNPVALRVKFK